METQAAQDNTIGRHSIESCHFKSILCTGAGLRNPILDESEVDQTGTK